MRPLISRKSKVGHNLQNSFDIKQRTVYNLSISIFYENKLARAQVGKKIEWEIDEIIDRSFELRGESGLIWSAMINWRLGNFFYFILKGHHHKISKKPLDAA